MTMAGGDFARHDYLQTRVKRLRGPGFSGESRIFEHQNATVSFFHRNQPGGFEQERAYVVVTPEDSAFRRVGLGGQLPAQHLPQRSEIARSDPAVEVFACRAILIGHRTIFGHRTILSEMRSLRIWGRTPSSSLPTNRGCPNLIRRLRCSCVSIAR